jgi:hypothetical protein
MKNKFNLIIAVALVSASALVSCSDFLKEDNKTGMSADLTYSTSSGIRGLVSSCYSFARGWYGKEAGLGLSEMGSDLFYYGGDNKQKPLVSYSITSESMDSKNSDNPCLDHYWELFYCAVDVCNNALRYVPECPAITDSEKQRMLGEAYFLRAFYYFHMVNIWGDIPYHDAAVTSVTNQPTRVPEAQVYDKIITDLDKSIAAFDVANYKTKADGRANYWSARALKARVLLYKASWLGDNASYALAQAEAEAVIDSPIASFYTNYNDMWDMNNEDAGKNLESIFGITYSDAGIISGNKENLLPKRYKTNATGTPLDYNELLTRKGYNYGGSAMLLMFVSKWDNGCQDLATSPTANNALYRVDNATKNYRVNTFTGENVYTAGVYSPYGRGFRRYLPSLYLWQTLEKYRATDQRTDATLLTAYKVAPGFDGRMTPKYPLLQDTAIYYCPLDGDSPEGQAKQAWAKNRYRIQFAYHGDIPIYTSGDFATAIPTGMSATGVVGGAQKAVSDVYGDNRYNHEDIGGQGSFPGLKKFLDNRYDPAGAAPPTHEMSARDAIVIRLSEMYLIKAECQLKTSGDALATINALRDVRAIPGKVVENRRTGSVTIDTILEERAIELCGEQQRWFDLKRTHKLIEYVQKYNGQGKDNVVEKHYYRPIPQAQLDACTNVVAYPGAEGKFWQNSGY